MAIYDFDRAMLNVLIGFSQDLIVGRLIVNIKISMINKGYAIITNKRNQLVTQELLTRKWRIGLEKAKEMLKAITQDNTILAQLHITRRYLIDLISQRLKNT